MAMTTDGRGWYVDRAQNVELPAGALMQFIGWGTSTQAEAIGDTDLIAQAPEARTTGTLSQPTATTDRVTGTVVATGTRAVTEVGRFNIATKQGANQHLLQRHVFTVINVELADSVAFTLDTLAA